MKTINAEQLPLLFEGVAEIFAEKKDELCALDAQLGDGDLGLTMSKGYGALPDLLRENKHIDDVGKMLMKAGLKMASLVPSTMGTLMSSGVMEGGKALKGKREIDSYGLAIYLNGFASGIQKRGKCNLGDRTVLDAVHVGAKTASDMASKGVTTLECIIDAAVKGATEGVEATRQMAPKFGKAAVFAAKALGTVDQGAVAGLYMLVGLQNAINKFS